MDGYKLVLDSVIQKLQSGKTVDEIISNVIESLNKEFDNTVNLDFFYELLEHVKDVKDNSYEYSNNEELEIALVNTLEEYNIDISNDILFNAFKILAHSDKLICIDGIPFCVKINVLLTSLYAHKEAILEYKRRNTLLPLKGGIAVYSNSNISECIEPRIHALDEALILTDNSVSVSLSKELLHEFNYNSYTMDFSFASLHMIGKENINLELVDEGKLDIIFNMRSFLNSSTPLKVEDFFKSAQISLLSFYKKNNFYDSIMNYKSKLSQEKIVDSINIIMEHFLEMPSSNVYVKCLKKAIQIKSYFFDLPVYEYRTASNTKLHPLFENEQEFQQISRTIL